MNNNEIESIETSQNTIENKKNGSNRKFFFILVYILILLFLSAGFIPSIQEYAVSFVEKIKHDDINDTFWKKQMSAFSTMGITIFSIIFFINISKKCNLIYSEAITEFKNYLKEIWENKKYLFILFALYFFGYFTIIRADFWNIAIDDLPRQMTGCREWVNFYRYISEIGSIFIHTSMNVFDIAPLTQFIAIAFLSLASLTVIKIFNKKITFLSCIASLPIGLYPYILSNISYRYDSPYMAFALLVEIIPFYFVGKRNAFIVLSVICNFLMCFSYQAASGIYIFMSVLVFLNIYLSEKNNAKKLLHYTITCILCYSVTLIFFSIIFISRNKNGAYVDNSFNPLMIATNIKSYLLTIFYDLKNTSTLLFSLLVIISFIITGMKITQQSKTNSFILIILSLLVSIPLSFGAYIGLSIPEFTPRAIMGLGVLLGCLSVFSLKVFEHSSAKNYYTKFSCVLLSYCVIAYSFAYGNAQAQQKRYINFRTTLLLNDLSKIVKNSDETIEILFKNEIDYCPEVKNLAKSYPLTKRSIDAGLCDGRSSLNILKSYGFCDFNGSKNHDFRNDDLPILLESDYHIIYGKDNYYLIEYKTPNHKVVKTRSFYD